jgi:hypothetical protein
LCSRISTCSGESTPAASFTKRGGLGLGNTFCAETTAKERAVKNMKKSFFITFVFQLSLTWFAMNEKPLAFRLQEQPDR